MNPPSLPQRIRLGSGPEVCSPKSYGRLVYVLTVASGLVADSAIVSHNSFFEADRIGRILYQDPSNKIIEIESESDSETTFSFIYHESSQDGREALAAEPNTKMSSFCAGDDAHCVFFLQTDENNIVEYQFEGHNYTTYSTRVIYGW